MGDRIAGRDVVGFWPNLWRDRRRVFSSMEFLWAAFTAVPAGFVAHLQLGVEQRVAIAGSLLVVVAALVAVVFTTLALTISLFSDSYLRTMSETRGGVMSYLRPFVLAIGVQVGAVISTVWYLAAAMKLTPAWEGIFFGLAVGLGLWSLLFLVALMRIVVSHALLRAVQSAVDDGEVVKPLRRNGTEQ